jgi:hypothetical protein
MADEAIRIEVKGLDELLAKFDKFPKQIARNMSQAGHEAANRVILNTEGLKAYPPASEGNREPTPYWIRGRGLETDKGNLNNSERMGTKWTTKREGFNTMIGNSASYAKWVHGDDQAKAMAGHGWKKLFEVAKDKLSQIQKVYQAWVDKTIKELGL